MVVVKGVWLQPISSVADLPFFMALIVKLHCSNRTNISRNMMWRCSANGISTAQWDNCLMLCAQSFFTFQTIVFYLSSLLQHCSMRAGACALLSCKPKGKTKRAGALYTLRCFPWFPFFAWHLLIARYITLLEGLGRCHSNPLLNVATYLSLVSNMVHYLVNNLNWNQLYIWRNLSNLDSFKRKWYSDKDTSWC